MPMLRSDLNIVKETSGDQEKKSILEVLKTVYLAVELKKEKEADSLEINKRKFVCLESNSDGLSVKKYDHKEFRNVIKSDRKEIYLALYVKESECDIYISKCKETLKNLVKGDVDNKVKIIRETIEQISNNGIYQFVEFHKLMKVYHEGTGLHIPTVLSDLETTLDNAGKYKNRLNTLDGIVQKLLQRKKQYEQIKSDEHFIELCNEFCSSRFVINNAIIQLNNMDKLDGFQRKINELRESLNEICPKEGKFSGEIHEVRNQINKAIEALTAFLNAKIKEDSVLNAGEEIGDLSELKEYTTLVDRVNVLKEEINEILREAEEATKIVEKDNQMKATMLQIYSEQIKPALLAIEEHKEKTSVDKKEILENIITNTKNLEDEINQERPSEENIKKIITDVKSLISKNIDMLNKNNGISFLVKNAKSGELVKELDSELSKFLSKFQMSSDKTVNSEVSSVQQIQPRP
jgi:hypothetical protein